MKKLILLLILTVISGSAFCKTITVTSSADSGAGTLRQAVLDASANDTIIFDNSITTVTLTSYVISLNKNITIIGDSISTTTILAPNSRHFVLPDMTGIGSPITANLKFLTLKDGYFYTCGGSIYNIKNTLILNNCSFVKNKAGDVAGAIDNTGTLIVRDCIFDSNTCNGLSSVGAILNTGYIYIYNSLFRGNQGVSAGCLINRNFAYVVNCLFITNTTGKTNRATLSNFKAGIPEIPETSFTVINSTIADNNGGGIYTDQEISLYNSILNNNTINDIIIDSWTY